jgi:hypothetical protein
VSHRIVFLVQQTWTWASVETVYESLRAHAELELAVVALPRPGTPPGEPEPDGLSRFLRARGIEPLSPAAFLADRRCDLLLPDQPWDLSRPRGFESLRLARLAPLAYVPYGLEIGGHFSREQFDLPLHRAAWRIFARSARHREMFARHCRAGAAHVVVSGHPKIDLVLRPATTSLSDLIGRERPTPASRVVLYSPHFSVKWYSGFAPFTWLGRPGWSTFVETHQLFLRAAARHPEHLFVMRAHPSLRGFSKRARVLDDRFWLEFDDQLERLPNATTYDGPLYQELFKHSDLLLTDLSSFLFEYLPTGKPIVYLHRPDGPGLNADGDIVESYYRSDGGDRFDEHLERLLAGDDPLREARVASIPRFLYLPPEGAGECVARHLVEALERGVARSPRPGSDRLVIAAMDGARAARAAAASLSARLPRRRGAAV